MLVALAALLQWLPQLTFALYAGALSDRLDRRTIIVTVDLHAFVWTTTSVAVRQRAVPIELQGRVASVNTVGVFGGLVIGSAVGGLLAQGFGVTAPFWFAFGGSALFLAAIWRELAHIAHADEAQVPEAFAS